MDRKRLDALFGFDYLLEMYKPKEQRIWGYYALPILYGDRLVGKLDATAERAEGVLRVDAVHEDEPFTQAMTEAVDAEIEDLATWLGLEVCGPIDRVVEVRRPSRPEPRNLPLRSGGFEARHWRLLAPQPPSC